ncbi:MAG: OmpA family protein [Hymenobacteraceae bacterium]|nr:OmpA family protein [Hymenobacteraceae bacterium]MDX5421333.1 OmpA family protein [Hymenobacteraceae bacterium]MDX5481126.1 OmpA family protein [Hymenobacteraceae bacterium]
MKKALITACCIAAAALVTLPVHAQINIGKKIQNKLNQKIDQQVDKKIDEALDSPKKIGAGKAESAEASAEAAEGGSAAAGAESKSMKAWTKYDFVAGDKIIFEDNLSGEENGEFPSRWDLNHGNAEVAVFGDEKVINLVSTGTSIKPLMKSEKWLPETFTIEMDVFFVDDNSNVAYEVYLYDDSKEYKKEVNGDFWDPIDIRTNGLRFKTYGSVSEELKAQNLKGQWRHVAIAFNKRSMKVYLDEHRLINIPNVNGTPTGFRLEIDKRIDATTMVKNVVMAEGGKKLYDQVLADGKIISYGIRFDVNKADIRPESVGTLAGIVKLMQEQADLKFSVEGHTDSDGDDSANMKLSQQRAEAVKAYLIAQGIPAARLEAKGWGESKPLDKNATPEAKSSNRRVEFVKL